MKCQKCQEVVSVYNPENNQNIAFCERCNFYFPTDIKAYKKKGEFIIPDGHKTIKLKYSEDSLEINFRWFRNYNFWQIFEDLFREDSRFIFNFFAYFFNRTSVFINKKHLKIEHKPVDLLPMVFYRPSYIKQLYVRRVSIENADIGTDHFEFELGSRKYGIYAKLANGKEELLIWNLKKATLLFIEQEIRRIFKIKN